MPVIIGARAESFENPLGLLTDCHRRIEMFLGALRLVAQRAQGNALSDEERDALEKSLRYFREAAPKHTADEEESLFPRLRRQSSPAVAHALAQVDALEREHRVADEHHAAVDRLGTKWLAQNHLEPAEAQQLQHALDELKQIYDRHIAIEDQQVFPLAKQVLPADEQKAVGQEMARRRDAKTCAP